MQDPLLSSLVGWYWVQKKSDLGIDDRIALRLGIIDINRARAGVESSIAIELIDRAIGLTKDIGSATMQGLTLAKSPLAGAAMVGAQAGAKKYTGSKKPTEADVEQALKVLGDAGLIGGQ